MSHLPTTDLTQTSNPNSVMVPESIAVGGGGGGEGGGMNKDEVKSETEKYFSPLGFIFWQDKGGGGELSTDNNN